MNYTETFEQFSGRLSNMDIALYAGIGLILWVLFKDKMSPIQKTIVSLIEKIQNKNISVVPINVPQVEPVTVPKTSSNNNADDIFFKLVVSWKQTRDLAEKSGCSEAVKVADQMFPFLSPNVCGKDLSK
jgi:hypothetical protein